jgi:hypothetical protein
MIKRVMRRVETYSRPPRRAARWSQLWSHSLAFGEVRRGAPVLVVSMADPREQA